MRVDDAGCFVRLEVPAVLVLICLVLISVPARADFSRSNGFETPAEVKRPPRQMVTSRPDDLRVAEEDRIYNEMTLAQREDTVSHRRVWLIAAGGAVACIVVVAVYFFVFRPRRASR
jgi:hypothetical protein